MNDRISPESKNTNTTSFDEAARIAEVESWLASQFDAAAGREVPSFEYTPRSITRLHALATASKANTRAANIIASDLRLKASDYRSQAVRIREILENVELALERLSPGAVRSAQVIANVANFLNLKDTEMSSFLIAMGDISLRKAGIEEERDKAKRESEVLLDYTRKALARLTFLKKTLQKLDDEVATGEAQMLNWKKNLALMVSKERQYMQQYSNYKVFLNHVGYTPDMRHGVLMKMAEHRKELEKKTKPILNTLRSYQDLPPDKALAALAIEDKRRQYAAAEKYLEEVLHSALDTAE
ncbi:HAUS augmin-like protein complex subunit 1 [Cinnamomum micranthum f. kanehirae]|uniref:HAUS augmin-like protein complex subunit 1 n=1 Tax=Cinnamomum micranthum f. kanehirae TaxID=337451 RepID=A0A3S3NAM3_9MAGN|nr:HAUS augmin-like protein complex subunit 1 [Cinnamomum micranthum f. kanehirae]